jgi:hypothetical protein
VYYPNENCRYAQNVLRFAHGWKEKGEWPDDVDLVHWNAGLWDVLELLGDGPLSTIEHYRNMIPRIEARLRLIFPKAKIVFATSTPVIEPCEPDFCRRNSVIEEYNAAAVECLKPFGTVINDLYAFARTLPDEYHSDNVHYNTEKGTEALGGRVVAFICRELGISASEINIESFEPEKYSKDNIAY